MIVSDAALMPVPDNSIDENAIVFGIPHLQSERNSFSEAEGCRPVRSSGKENEEYC
jgi:ubiquinone/menaquinone biosynthesis C-methylase UbiE